MDEVKQSLKDLRKELMTKRKENMMPVSKLSKASVMAELGKYKSPVKHVEVEIEKIAKVKPSPKADKVVEKHIEQAVKEVNTPSGRETNKSKSNPRMRKSETISSSASVESEEKVKPARKVKEMNKEMNKETTKKPLTQYSKLWGEARKNGMSPKDASEWAKSKLK